MKEAQEFMASLKECPTQTDDQDMFFDTADSSRTWNNLKVPAHVDAMGASERVGEDAQVVEEVKMWLLKQKQTQQWDSPVATADAVYALSYNRTNLLGNQGDVRIVLGNEMLEMISPAKTTVPGLGYTKKIFTDGETVDAAEIIVEKRDPGIIWGGVCVQFEESLGKAVHQGSGLNVDRKLYMETIAHNNCQLQPIIDKAQLKVDNKVVVRLTVRLDRATDFIQLKDRRAAYPEPTEVLFGYCNVGDVGCYVAVKNTPTGFSFDTLNRGTYVLEYGYRVDRTGSYETGIATIQSVYIPEYAAHSVSFRCNISQ